MKPQDVLFFIVYVVLVLRRKSEEFALSGITALAGAAILFSTWTFFTAERLTWYAAAFFLGSIILLLMRPHTVQ